MGRQPHSLGHANSFPCLIVLLQGSIATSRNKRNGVEGESLESFVVHPEKDLMLQVSCS